MEDYTIVIIITTDGRWKDAEEVLVIVLDVRMYMRVADLKDHFVDVEMAELSF